MDPLEHLSKGGSLNQINITVDDLHSLAVLKVLADHFGEYLTRLSILVLLQQEVLLGFT